MVQMSLAEVRRWDAKLQIDALQELSSQTSARVYVLTAEQAKTEGGGLELEFILSGKPNSNSIAVPFSRENAVFYYQPPLTEEFKQEDCEVWTPTHVRTKKGEEFWRPKNVVGSYAVYHASKRDGVYKTGKICHVYRPQLIDADGKTAWAEFNRDAEETGVLTITLPHEFLDSAMYPVVVDPTFGYTSIGATTATYAQITGQVGTPLDGDGTVDSISAYYRTSSGTSHMKAALYEYVAARDAGALIAETEEIEIDTTAQWNVMNFPSPPSVTDGTTYYLCVWQQSNALWNYDSTGGGNENWYRSQSYGSWSDPMTSEASYGDPCYSIYATYTQGGGEPTLVDVADSLELSDVTLANKPATVADTVSVLDAAFRHKPSVPVLDLVNTTETILSSRLLSTSDSVTLTDVTRALKTLKVPDALSLLDAVSTPIRVLQALDAVDLADGALVHKTLVVCESVSLVEVVGVGVGGVKRTRLFLILGDLAVQLTGD
jgi:hypothetical protein